MSEYQKLPNAFYGVNSFFLRRVLLGNIGGFVVLKFKLLFF